MSHDLRAASTHTLTKESPMDTTRFTDEQIDKALTAYYGRPVAAISGATDRTRERFRAALETLPEPDCRCAGDVHHPCCSIRTEATA